MQDSLNLWISGIGLLLAGCNVSTRGQADEGQAMASTSGVVDPTSTSGTTSTSSPSPTTSGGDATSAGPGTTSTMGITDAGTTQGATTGDPDGVCPACESAAAACDASWECQAVASFAPDCPAETLVNCVVQAACENLMLDNAIAGLHLWITLDRCAAYECSLNPPCLAEEDTCMGNPACKQIDECVQQTCICLPGDQLPACWGSCGDLFPDGRDDWTAWLSCLLAEALGTD